jgi:hypothetical protein
LAHWAIDGRVRLLLDGHSARAAGGGRSVTRDFEVLPIGTKDRLEALEAYARQASYAFSGLVNNASELMTLVADLRLADPIPCAARIESRIMNARRRYSPTGGKR